MIVVDASAYLELVLGSASGQRLEQLLEHEDAFAPHLLDAEVLHRVTQWGKHGRLSPHQARDALADLRDAPIARIDHRVLLADAVVRTAALSGYDALYAALSARLGCRLVTADGPLAATVRQQLGGEVEVLGTSGRA